MNKKQLALAIKYTKIIVNKKRPFDLSIKSLKLSITSDFPTVKDHIIEDFVKLFVGVSTCLSIDIKPTFEQLKSNYIVESKNYALFKRSFTSLQKSKDKFAEFCMFLVDYNLHVLEALEEQEDE